MHCFTGVPYISRGVIYRYKTMDDPLFYNSACSPQFVGKQPKQQCLDWIKQRPSKNLSIFTKNVYVYQAGGLYNMLRMIASTYVEDRCFYEVVPPNNVCKLFFDLDFKLIAPQTRKESAVKMDTFVRDVLTPTVRMILIKSCAYEDPDAADPYILCADTSKKISRHIVFPDIVFENITNVGAFVSLVKASLSDKHTFYASIDSGVYTRWRNFRLVGSTKKGKSNHLVLTSHKGLSLIQQMLRTMLTVIAPYSNSIPCKVCRSHVHQYKRIIALSNVVKTVASSSSTVYNAAPVEFPPKTHSVIEFVERTVLQKKFPTHGFSRTFQRFNGHDFVDYVISPGIPCPFNGNASHNSNKTYFKIDLTCNVCFFRCADPSCSKERFGTVYDVNRECDNMGLHRTSNKRPRSNNWISRHY